MHNICLGCCAELQTEGICPQCRFNRIQQPNPHGTLPLGTLLTNDFVVGKMLGRGGFGATYLAYDIQLSRAVAIKEYLPREQCQRETNQLTLDCVSPKEELNYQYGLDKFLEEAKTLARLGQIPGVVNVIRFFKENNTGYMVMDYLEGITLETYLQTKNNKIPYSTTYNIMIPIIDALKEVHQTGLLHRDISPDNIFITHQKQIKIIDFGAARMSARDHSQNFSIILKEGYAPEEQYRTSGKQGPWTDVYALAATFYRCITGELPQQSLDRALDEDRLQPPSKLGVALSQVQETALLKALAVKAKDRFQDAGEFQEALMSSDKKPASTPNEQKQSFRNAETISKEDYLKNRIKELQHDNPELAQLGLGARKPEDSKSNSNDASKPSFNDFKSKEQKKFEEVQKRHKRIRDRERMVAKEAEENHQRIMNRLSAKRDFWKEFSPYLTKSFFFIIMMVLFFYALT